MAQFTQAQIAEMASTIATHLVQEMEIPEDQHEMVIAAVCKGVVAGVNKATRNILPTRN